ncbi:MAG TPA: DUF4157 domain-containing protein [Candidatus Nanoarchaeia archaeon]|nr:DUF4157 domain-containing protein [Candidatus Nanoarchaeia archaeon]
MSSKVQTKVQASPVQSFAPVQTGLLQRQCALCNTPGLVEDSGRDEEKLTLQRSSADQGGTTTMPPIVSRLGHDFSKVSVHSTGLGLIQTKLKINEPEDPYEQEADRVADQVMRMPELRQSSSVGDSSLTDNTIPSNSTTQRACASCSDQYKINKNESRYVEPVNICPNCQTQKQGLIQTKQITPLIQRQESLEEEEDEEVIQAKIARDVTPEMTPAISSDIQSMHGGGRPLSGSERGFFEPRFGVDFSNVRVHNDTKAASVAKSVNARAFTLGRNVVFGAGEFSSNTLAGRKLLAHELTHVVQQISSKQAGEQTYIQREADEDDTEAEDISDAVELAPDFGPEINEPECPPTPTNLGNVRPAPDCPDDEEELGGRHFKFCIDSDVFTNTERAKLREFVRKQPAMTTFNIHGYASVDGGVQYNMRLSCHRAKRAARELINDGVPSQQIDIAKKGETRRFGAASENRTVLIHTETPDARIPDAELETPQQIVDAAVERILGGQYRLAADAYLSRWTCGRMPDLREMVQRITIKIENQGRFPQKTNILGLVGSKGRHEIVLSRETFETTDPVACAMARIIDMGSHHFISRTRGVGLHGSGIHPAALFLVELAGLDPCVTPAATVPDNPDLVLTPAHQWWHRRVNDPLRAEPLPACADAPLPGSMGTPPIGSSTTAPPNFVVDHLDTHSGSGDLIIEMERGGLRARSPRGAFRFRAIVSAAGDPGEIAQYEVGFLQTIMSDETLVEFVDGQAIRLNQPVPIRDGPPRGFAPPPWFEPREVQRFDAANTAEVRLSDSPSKTMPLEFVNPELLGRGNPIERGNALNRTSSRIVFHTWVAARRDNAPLTRFSTFFLDGGIVNWSLDVDLVGERGTGSFDSRIDPAPGSTTGMQLQGPTAAETSELSQLVETTGVIPAVPRARAGGLPLPQWRDEVRRVVADLKPLRRALGLEHRLMVHIRVDPATGRIELPFVDRSRDDLSAVDAESAQNEFRSQRCLDLRVEPQRGGLFTVRATCPRPAVTVESRGDGEPSTGPAKQQFADALFVRLRKDLILAPETPDPARVAIPVVLQPLAGGRPRQPGSSNPFAPEHGVGLVTLIAEDQRRIESQERFARAPEVYDPEFSPDVDIKLSLEQYDYNFRIPGLEIDTVCQDPSLRTEGCVTVQAPGYNLVVRPRFVRQDLDGEAIQSPIGVKFISFPVRFTLFTPREKPGGSTYNHELHHMVVAHRLIQNYKFRLERRVRARLMNIRRLAANRPDLAHDLLSQRTIETIVSQEYEPFSEHFRTEYQNRQLEVHARENREESLPPAQLPAEWHRPIPRGGDRGFYHRSTAR